MDPQAPATNLEAYLAAILVELRGLRTDVAGALDLTKVTALREPKKAAK